MVATLCYEAPSTAEKELCCILKVDSSLTPTVTFLAETLVGAANAMLPMPDGMITEGRIAGVDSTIHYAPDGTILNSVAPPLDNVGGFPNGGGVGNENWFISLDEVDNHIYYYERTGGAGSSNIRRLDLTLLDEDTPGWYPVDMCASFIVSPNGHRVAIHEWDFDPDSTGMYRVYDRSGSLLIEKSNITPNSYLLHRWPCEYHLNPISAYGWQHTVGNRVAFRTDVINYYSVRKRVGKMPLDSILAFFLLARDVENNPNSPFNFFIRGQWSHFDYTDWPV